MIKIAVLDDDEAILSQIVEILETTVEARNDITILSYADPEECLKQMKDGVEFDIMFCDIEMGRTNGIEFGKQVKRVRPNMYLIYLTSYAEFALEGFGVEAYQYILKSDMETRLSTILKQVLLKVELEKKNYRILGTVSDKMKVYYDDVLYFEKAKNAKYVRFVTVNGEIRERMTLDEARSRFDRVEFVWVERGCVVNIRHITRIKNNIIYLTNQEQLVISRNRAPKVREYINKYWGIL